MLKRLLLLVKDGVGFSKKKNTSTNAQIKLIHSYSSCMGSTDSVLSLTRSIVYVNKSFPETVVISGSSSESSKILFLIILLMMI